MTEMKPCPFCGCSDIKCVYDDQFEVWFINCPTCNVWATNEDSEEELTETWNRRD